MSRFLEHGRYNRALGSHLHPKFAPIEVPDDLATYLEQEWITQNALDQLGVESNSAPCDIPGISQFHVKAQYIEQLPDGFQIDVMGMPRAGKTSVLRRFNETSEYSQKVHFIPENVFPLSTDKDIKYKVPGLLQSMTQVRLVEIFEFIDRYEDPKPLLLDRGVLDRVVFKRTMFQKGDVPANGIRGGFKHSLEEEIIDHPIGAVILCLARPEISLEREGMRDKPGYIMNEDFLAGLYEQYLRLYYELVSGTIGNADVLFDYDIPVPIVIALDMEGDEEANYKIFDTAMQQILFLTGKV